METSGVATERFATSRLGAFLRACVHSNLIIAFAAVGLGVITVSIAGLPFDPLPLLGVFAAAFLAYTINRLLDRDEDSQNLPGRHAYVTTYGPWMLRGGILLYLLAIVLTILIDPLLTAVLLLPVGFAVLYSAGHAKRIFVVKNGFVGMVWAGIPVGMGLYYGQPFAPQILLLAAIVFLLLSAAAAVFDIKDVEGDRLVGVRTLPVVYGETRTKQLAIGTSLATVPLIVTGAILLSPRFLLLLLYPAYLVIAIPFATPERGPLYYGLVIDGEHILVGLLAVGIVL